MNDLLIVHNYILNDVIYVLYEHGNADMFPKYSLLYNVQNCLAMGWRFLWWVSWFFRSNANLYETTFLYIFIRTLYSNLLHGDIITSFESWKSSSETSFTAVIILNGRGDKHVTVRWQQGKY